MRGKGVGEQTHLAQQPADLRLRPVRRREHASGAARAVEGETSVWAERAASWNDKCDGCPLRILTRSRRTGRGAGTSGAGEPLADGTGVLLSSTITLCTSPPVSTEYHRRARASSYVTAPLSQDGEVTPSLPRESLTRPVRPVAAAIAAAYSPRRRLGGVSVASRDGRRVGLRAAPAKGPRGQ